MPVTRQPGTHSVVHELNARHYVDTFSALTAPPRMNSAPPPAHATSSGPRTHGTTIDTLTPQFVDFKAEDGTRSARRAAAAARRVRHGEERQVPLILNPYGGPQAQEVRDSARAMDAFDQVLAHRGFAVLKVDNRGMGNRGRAFALAAITISAR